MKFYTIVLFSVTTFHISDTPINLVAKTIKPHVCSATKTTALLRKIKIAPATLPTIASDASTTFIASLLTSSFCLFNQFFKVSSSFRGEGPEVAGLHPPPKTPVIARTIVEMVRERGVIICITVIPCTWSKVWILSAKDASSSRTLSRVCLILAVCVWITSQICDSIWSLAWFSVFMSSSVSLYS